MKSRLRRWRAEYADMLFGDIIPFWELHAFDPEGGINTCIADDGTVCSRDKWGWSQWRAVWVYARLLNHWNGGAASLSRARGIADFLMMHGPLADGHWPLLLAHDGTVIRGYESIYTDGFAVLALGELGRIAGNESCLDHMKATLMRAHTAIEAGTPPAWPYPILRGRIAHGISMLFSHVAYEAFQACPEPWIEKMALRHHRAVMETFLDADTGLIREWMNEDGTVIDEQEGQTIVPGHAVESLWMQMLIARTHHDLKACDLAVRSIRKHLELGWDTAYGGLFLAIDETGRPDVTWPFADCKLWWPQVEALVATLEAYRHSRETWCLEWHERIRDYCLAHYPMAKYGEWTQRLDREGRPFTQTVALPVKDPFHLPRALMACIETIDLVA